MDNRIYVIYIRTNRRVKWKYADYCGRWASVDEAVKAAEEHAGASVSFEYRIENRATGETITGLEHIDETLKKGLNYGRNEI